MATNNASVTLMENSNDKIYKYKLIGWLLVAGNLIGFFTVLISEYDAAQLAVRYSFFTLMHLTALTCTVFALKDNRPVLLYPILVSLVFFISISLFLWIICTATSIYCKILEHKNLHMTLLNCDDAGQFSLPLNIFLMIFAIEKVFEFILFRRLMQMLERQQYDAHFQDIQIKNAFSPNADTDDEIVVFEKVSQSGGGPKIYDYGTQRPSA